MLRSLRKRSLRTRQRHVKGRSEERTAELRNGIVNSRKKVHLFKA